MIRSGRLINEVLGKGKKLRQAVLADRVAVELFAFLGARGVPADLRGCEGALPVIDRLRDDEFEERVGQGASRETQ